MSLGMGRFVYTPIMPLMQDQAGLTAQAGALVATANYLGYFLGALLTMLAPRTFRTRTMLRACLVALVVTSACMPLTRALGVWFLLRGLSGVASAVVFVIAVNSVLTTPGAIEEGGTFAGAGAGIALSGLLVVWAPFGHAWTAAWWSSAALTAVLTAGAWSLGTGAMPAANARPGTPQPRSGRWFVALLVSYFLEGLGYIIAGTFLVAALKQSAPGLADTAWVLVGLAAIPACVLWAGLSRRRPRQVLLPVVLALQAVGVALPVLSSSGAAALVSAALFGGTFLAVGMIVMPIGARLGVQRSVAVLTVAYGLGQILGPLLVTPLLDQGYGPALLVGSVIVAGATAVAALLGVRCPRFATAPAESTPVHPAVRETV
ncbi:YbfB/YjiJ family MFS transporter [Streptoverticillium reticulum]|uniref:YbfB/YjiJ family MFS transporter n=1 Tax=Streptoverticillium reticulum TaxID=1433415 RepID=UPI0039BF04A5